MIVFERCNPERRAALGLTCKTEAEINEWLIAKYFIVRENNRAFVQHKFGEERINDKSQLKWYPISNVSRVDVVRMITRSDMLLNDSIMNIGSLQTEKNFGYKVNTIPSRDLPYQNNFHNAITYEMSLD